MNSGETFHVLRQRAALGPLESTRPFSTTLSTYIVVVVLVLLLLPQPGAGLPPLELVNRRGLASAVTGEWQWACLPPLASVRTPCFLLHRSPPSCVSS